MQPTFMPWLGYFDLIDQSDVFVFLDDVQFVRRSWMHRNRIKTANGELFLPVHIQHHKSHTDLMLNQARISHDQPWTSKHLKSITQAYRKAPCYSEVYPWLEAHYEAAPVNLAEWNSTVIKDICERIGLSASFCRSSDLHNITGQKDTRLLQICQAVDCNTYLSTPGSSDYIESKTAGGAIQEAGIPVFYHHYQHPQYPQLYGEFVPYMAVLDLLFNVGFSGALSVIRSGRRPAWPCQEYRENMMNQFEEARV